MSETSMVERLGRIKGIAERAVANGDKLQTLGNRLLDALERERAIKGRMESALKRIAGGTFDGLEVTHMSARECRDIARAALSPEAKTGEGRE